MPCVNSSCTRDPSPAPWTPSAFTALSPRTGCLPSPATTVPSRASPGSCSKSAHTPQYAFMTPLLACYSTCHLPQRQRHNHVCLWLCRVGLPCLDTAPRSSDSPTGLALSHQRSSSVCGRLLTQLLLWNPAGNFTFPKNVRAKKLSSVHREPHMQMGKQCLLQLSENYHNMPVYHNWLE